MAVNSAFKTSGLAATTSEQNLYADLIREAIQIHGHDVNYIDRTLTARDDIFGEDSLSTYSKQQTIEMYVEDAEGGYQGEKELIQQFGLENRNEITFVVHRTRFDDVAHQLDLEDGTDTTSGGSILLESGTLAQHRFGIQSATFDSGYLRSEEATLSTYASRPKEGDLVYHPVLNKLFEVSFVDHDEPFHQLDNNPVYKLRCRQFEYSSEVLDTGVANVDAIEDALSGDQLNYQFTIETDTNTALGTVTLSGGSISAVSITTGGTYAIAPTVTFSAPPQGVVNAANITTTGAGHTNGAQFNMTGGSGSGMVIQGTGSGGMVGFTIISGGTGYQVGDVLSTTAAVPATITVTGITNNTTATGTTVINSSGAVTSVNITNGGTGYTGSDHTVTFSTGDTGSILLENSADTGDASYLINEEYIVGDMDTDKTAQNEFFEKEDETILDFTESNPFGDAGRT